MLTVCLQQGKLSKELNFVQHNFRTKLDELKREEMNRLRMLIKAKHDIKEGNGKYLKERGKNDVSLRNLNLKLHKFAQQLPQFKSVH